MGPRRAETAWYPSASAVARSLYWVMPCSTAATSCAAAACCPAVGGVDGTGAITMPSGITVAPTTFGQMVLGAVEPVPADAGVMAPAAFEAAPPGAPGAGVGAAAVDAFGGGGEAVAPATATVPKSRAPA